VCEFFKHIVRSLVLLFICVFAIPGHAEQATVNGAGGTAIYPVLSQWADLYHEKAQVAVNYQAVGSGAGIAQIKAKTVDFANSDKPLTPDDLKTNGLVQFPTVIIGITPIVNIPNVNSAQLTLDGDTLAAIFLGRIKKWNDKLLQPLNPGVALPDLDIKVVHRSDGSGTTFNFTDYLSKVSPDWKGKAGSDTTIQWPVGIGAKGSDGVSAEVQKNSGSIGYIEYAYAVQKNLAVVRLKNREGKIVEPKSETFQSAAANADFAAVPDFYLILTNQSGTNSWPITAGTYVMLRRDAPKEKNTMVVKFLTWCMTEGQAQSKQLNYVPLPDKTLRWIKAYWKSQLGIEL